MAKKLADYDSLIRRTILTQRQSDVVADQYSFSVVLEPQEGGGFTVLVPALPEAVTEGDTEQEALANAEEAIRAVLAYRRDQDCFCTCG